MKSKTFNPAGRCDHLLVLDGGDDVMQSLIDFAQKKHIRGASLHGIGAFSKATVAYWNKETKVYEEISVEEQVEVLSIAGSLTVAAGDEVKVHAHVVLGRRDGSAIGGHLLRATVFPTLEVFVTDTGAPLVRAKDEATGLMLLAPDQFDERR
jgi:predicted DNA-binding protein with PD1-like motif